MVFCIVLIGVLLLMLGFGLWLMFAMIKNSIKMDKASAEIQRAINRNEESIIENASDEQFEKYLHSLEHIYKSNIF